MIIEREEELTVSYPGLLTRYRKALVCARLAPGVVVGGGEAQFTTRHAEAAGEESFWIIKGKVPTYCTVMIGR